MIRRCVAPLLLLLAACLDGEGGGEPPWLNPSDDRPGEPAPADEPPVTALSDLGIATVDEAFLAFSDCMRYGDWVATGMDELVSVRDENTAEGQCSACHSGAAIPPPNFFASSLEFYDEHRTPAGVQWISTVEVGDDGLPIAFEPIEMYGRPGLFGHPPYVLDPWVSTAISSFVGRTEARLFAEEAACVRE